MSAQDTSDARRRVLTAIFLMVALSIVVFWLPIVGPLMVGFVGGRVVRRLDHTLLAAVLPAILVGLLAVFGWHYVPYPIAGILAGGDFLRAILFDSLPLLVGAVVGAVLP